MDKNILIELLKMELSKIKNEHRQWLFLVNCIQSNGYLKEGEEPVVVSEEDNVFQEFEEDRRRVGLSSDENDIPQNVPPPPQQFIQSIQEREHSSVSGPFSRTFIQTNDPRLLELQKRTMEQEEVEYNKIKEQVSLALNQVIIKYNNSYKLCNGYVSTYKTSLQRW